MRPQYSQMIFLNFMMLASACSVFSSKKSSNASSADSSAIHGEISQIQESSADVAANSDSLENGEALENKPEPEESPVVLPGVVVEKIDEIIESKQTVEQKALSILDKSCASCHSVRSDGDFGSVLDVQKMIQEGHLVVGQPEASSVYTRTNPQAAGPMPIGTGLTDEDRKILNQWITELVVDETPAQNIAWSTIYELARKDLDGVSPVDREQMRYVSFHHISEKNLGPDTHVRHYDALTRSLNSISKAATAAKPFKVNEIYGLYRFSLNDIGLDFDTYRQTFENHSPFQASDSQDQNSEFLRDEIGVDAVVRGDWLVSTMLLPPVYKEWLSLPDTLQELKQNLQIESESFLEKDNLVRAGFVDSRVSTQNRIIQREVSANNKFFWESFDFLENSGFQNVLLNPLGPQTENPNGPAFEQDGGEMIFELANGFMGFYLSDGVGNYLEKGPKPVVLNSEGPEHFDQNILNGISCLDCHRAGLIPHVDQVRNFAIDSNFSDGDLAQILEIYPVDATVEAYIKGDSDVYQKSIQDSGNTTPLVVDVIREVYDRYHQDVSIEQASLELDLSEDMIKILLLSSATFRDQWAGFLVEESISREQFNRLFGSAKRIYDLDVQIPILGDLHIDTGCMQEAVAILEACVDSTINIELE